MSEEDIFDFINSSRVATVCCVEHGDPYCFNCFYSFMHDYPGIVFKSSDSSRHTGILKKNPSVAGTIYNCGESGIDNAGVQFKGAISRDEQYIHSASGIYYRRFPLAAILPGSLYVIEFIQLKYTRTKNAVRNKCSWTNHELI